MARVGLVAPIFQFWDRPTDSLVARFDHAILKNDTQTSVRGAVRAVQDREASAASGSRSSRMSRCMYGHAVTDVTQDANSASVTVRGPDGERDPQGRLCDRRRRRPQHRAQAVRHRVRRLHLARALHRVHDAVRFREQPRLLLRAATSPTPARGAIASRSRPTARPGCGARSSRPTPRRPKRN